MKTFYPYFLFALFLLLNLPSQAQPAEPHNFVTYDTTFNVGYNSLSYILHISRPINADTMARPAIIAMNTDLEVGATNLTARYGPGYWLANGWDGGVQLSNGTHYPLIITIQPNQAWPTMPELLLVMNYILNTYHIKRNSVHLCGIGMGAAAWTSLICYQNTPDGEEGMKNISSLVCLQGQSNAVSSAFFQNELPGYSSFGHWAKKYHGKFFGLEGAADTTRCVWLVSKNMNDSVAGSAYFSYEKLNGGAFGNWNSMYQPSATNWTSVGTLGPNNSPSQMGVNSMGTYKSASNIFQWMLGQGDTSLAVTANGGGNQIISYPASSVKLTGTSSLGSVASYKWKLLNGPNVPVIGTPTLDSTTITGLVPGTYVYALVVTSPISTTTTSNDTITVNAGVIPGKLEAESYNTMLGVQTQTTTDAGGGLNVGWIDRGDWMTYKVDVLTAGVYIANFRVASATTSNGFQLRKADGTVLAYVNVPNTGGSQNWQTISVPVTLQAGQQSLQVFSTAPANWNINWMQFVSESVVSLPGKVETENYTAMSGVQTQATTDVGGGMSVGWIDQGDWMDYNVNVTTAGTYIASFRISTPNATGAGFQLKLANGTVLATLTLPNTTGLSNWQTVNVAVTLPAGAQTLRLASTSTLTWGINWMDFESSSLPAIPGTIQAETYSQMSGVQIENTSDTSGVQDVGWINQGDWMDYNVNVAAAGTYTVNFRIATAAAGGNFQVRQANGTVLATIALPNTAGLIHWQTVTTTLSLTAGPQILRIYSTNTVGWNLNWMQFVLSSTFAIPGKIEAEYYTSMSGVATETTSAAGGGKDVGWIDTGDWMNYNVKVATAGIYIASFEIATPKLGASLQLKLANGTVLCTVTLPNTGGFQRWQTVTAVVNLPAGNQTLQLSSTGSTQWNINSMGFETLAAQAIPGKIEAENYTSMSGIGTESTSDAGGGMDVGWIDNGDWLKYEVNVASAGVYTVAARVATPNANARFQIRLGDGTLLNNVNLPNTGGTQKWQTITTTVTLPAGIQTVQIFSSNTPGWNLNWLQFTAGTVAATQTLISETTTKELEQSPDVQDSLSSGSSFTLYPNPVTDHFTLDINNSATGPVSVQLISLSGQVIRALNSSKDQSRLQLNFPASNISAGIYLVRVQIGSQWSIVKKIVKL
ncbi:MAG TPA: carbohydrate-binding protein [Puia sp.]|nr:carbohydrate-binding protein [Puia sp.]